MTPEELRKAVSERMAERTRNLEAILPPARAAVNALKDAGQHNTARELEAALFAYDAGEDSGKSLIRDNFETIIDMMVGKDS